MNKVANQGLACTVVLCIVFSLSGCANRHGVLGVDRCADIPPGAVPEPAGNKLCNWQKLQVSGASADLSVLYRADFIADSADLAPAARERMGRLIYSDSAHCLQWVIEPSGDAALDLDRVESVIDELTLRGASPVDVTVATPAAIGLSGPQAERIASGFGQNSNAPSNSTFRLPGQFDAFGFGGFGAFGGQ